MDTRTLEIFVAAAEYENFRMAAEKLFITQPAVTFQIRQLENEIGDKLFVKNGRKIILTETGRLFHQEAKRILGQYEKSLSQINRYRQGYDKTIRIAISPLLADTILPSVLRAYTKQHPNVEISIQVLESRQISDDVESGNVDIGLSCLRGNSAVNTFKFHEESVVLVSNHDGYDAESGPIIDAKELLEHNIMLTDNHPAYWDDIKAQLKKYLSPYKLMKVSQSHIAKRFVLEGIGVSFLPKSIINREIMEGRLLEIPVSFMTLPTASMYIIYKYEHEIERNFMEFISNFHFS
ncbi:LysR family transcriptional regulator, repressor for citA [Lentibacillus halodurans]|uniref:LysR family transcriptional regulator, repressor for citA n=1 Tax=Lentibacillus halodurans TaxID=237679 RepID=A0A1I0VF39_9BACI|nr:LysR family transcriptional regulator [Lentibacillus halodurans]SFA74985.1 LysR family transcriptional regulator, repressor for citA [Lentibacillus halodurans]